MNNLIKQLELVGGPDRKLDLAISVATNFRGEFDPTYEWRWGAGGDEIEGHKDGKRRAALDPAQFVPRWTESIDAALRLVPGNHTWSVDSEEVDGAGDVIRPAARVCAYGKDCHIGDVRFGATPAIALCVAALDALSHIK